MQKANLILFISTVYNSIYSEEKQIFDLFARALHIGYLGAAGLPLNIVGNQTRAGRLCRCRMECTMLRDWTGQTGNWRFCHWHTEYGRHNTHKFQWGHSWRWVCWWIASRMVEAPRPSSPSVSVSSCWPPAQQVLLMRLNPKSLTKGIKSTLANGKGRLWHRVAHGKCVRGSRLWSGHKVRL